MVTARCLVSCIRHIGECFTYYIVKAKSGVKASLQVGIVIIFSCDHRKLAFKLRLLVSLSSESLSITGHISILLLPVGFYEVIWSIITGDVSF